jgi:CyaY protein
MTETEFMTIAGRVLDQVEAAFERAGETADVDVECSRSGNVLEIEFVDQGSKIIVNTQAPMQEIWVAARAGGFHYRLNEGRWLDTREGTELYAALSSLASGQTGQTMTISA